MEKKVRRVFTCVVMSFIALSFYAFAAQGVINVNTATKEELMMLPGIGEKTASAIVAYRQVNGPFKTIDDMTRIKGISKKKLDKLRPYLALTGQSTYIPAGLQGKPMKNASKPKS